MYHKIGAHLGGESAPVTIEVMRRVEHLTPRIHENIFERKHLMHHALVVAVHRLVRARSVINASRIPVFVDFGPQKRTVSGGA